MLLLRRLKSQALMKKALLFVIVFIIIPMLLIFGFASNQASHAIKLQVGKALYELNKQNHTTMDRVMESIDQTTVTLMSSGLVQKWHDSVILSESQRVAKYVETEKLLSDYSGQVKYSLFVLTNHPSDYYFAPTTEVSDSGVFFIQDFKGRPWLQKAVQVGGAGSVELIDRLGFNPMSEKTVAYVRGVADLTRGGNTVGILVATEIESVLGRDINSVALPDRAREFLTEKNGTVLVGSGPIASAYSIPDNGKKLLPNIWTTNDNMYIYHDSPAYANRLIYEIPLNSLVGSHRDVQEIIQISAFCYFIVILFFLFYLGKSLLRPMARLASLTRSYEPGIRAVRLPEEDREDEIGFVYRSFYSMTERLNQLIKEKYVMEIKQKESELLLLHSQITPHLLYNTLDSVYWYGIRGGVPEVADMVRDLSTLLRIGLSRGKEIITIREELNHVEAYLHLQEKRYNHSFNFHIHVEEDAEDCLLPKVIIQPLVENSILHGIGKMDGEGEVWIGIQAKDNELLITVEDNGFRPVDMDKIHALLSGTAEPDKGFGIRNVNKRIQLRFGNTYGLTYFVREGGGTKAEIKLPEIRSMNGITPYTD